MLQVKAGDTLRLDASASADPDNDNDSITFLWWQQPELGTIRLSINDERAPALSLHIPDDAAGQTIHLICEVSDTGSLNLKSYQRVILSVQ